TQCVGASLGLLISLGVPHEYSDATHTFRLLCAHRKGPCDCPATNNFDEIAPPHHGPRRSGSDKVSVTASINTLKVPNCRNVRFGSKADMCAAKRHVCFTPNSDRESGHRPYSMTSSARPISVLGTSRPSALAVFRLM